MYYEAGKMHPAPHEVTITPAAPPNGAFVATVLLDFSPKCIYSRSCLSGYVSYGYWGTNQHRFLSRINVDCSLPHEYMTWHVSSAD
jgi:hypothetical protein